MSTVLICPNVLCGCTHHLLSEGARAEHTQPWLKDRNCWRHWEWNEESLKILEWILGLFIPINTSGDTEEEPMTGSPREGERSAYNRCICRTTTISHQTVGEGLAWESGKKYLITPCNISLSSYTGKWYWGFTWQNEHNPTYTLRSESLIRTFSFSFSSLASLSFNWFWQRSSLILKQTAITEGSEVQNRDRQKLKKCGKNCCYSWSVVFWGTQDINLTWLRLMLLLTYSALQQF